MAKASLLLPGHTMKNANIPWKPGTQILQQDLWGDKLITARPVTVVEDKPDCPALDIRVEPDLSWSWKDRDEFDELVRRGWFTDDE